ncbi:ribonuclease III [Eubacteriales bacterium OttesenSCG-928-K08]|nr:ribonuclease III [Eubacteriales bacterium OttesenSCG-928-K08]
MSQRSTQLDTLQQALGYRFKNIEFLETALTHTSYSKGDGKGSTHNERLEFLGDAVLELCVSEQIFTRFDNLSEGEMTRARARIVCEASLNKIAREHFLLQEYLLLGHGEDVSGGRDKPSIVSDAFEAVLGAVYLDGGIEAARALVLLFADELLGTVGGSLYKKDHKSRLQEYVQKRRLGMLQYRLVGETGPDHCKVFQMQVLLDEEMIGLGEGNSKQEAGQQAAKAALSKLSTLKLQRKTRKKEKQR